jgi:hypothetical protein
MFKSKYREPLCPCCNAALGIDDTYDMEYDDEGIILYHIGHCPKCDRDYQWQASAVFTSWANTNLREV